MEKVILLNPPSDILIYREDRCQNEVDAHLHNVIRPPISLMGLAAISEKLNFQTRIIDAPIEKVSLSQLKKILNRWKPHWVVVNTSLGTLPSDLSTLKAAKDCGSKTIIFGYAPTIKDREIMERIPYIDYAIRGEPEKTFQELIEKKLPLEDVRGLTFRVNDSIIQNPDRKFIKNLDELPFAAHHLIKNKLYRVPTTGETFTTIQTSRGCPYHCTFCLSNLLNGVEVRQRSVDNVLEEIKGVLKRVEITNFFFRGDTFTINKQWVLQLCRKIIESKLKITWFCNSRVDTVDYEMLLWMRKAGCQLITYGVESGDSRILRYIKKGITKEQVKKTINLTKKAGILTGTFYIIGLPGDTLKTIYNTIQFSKEVDSDIVEFIPFIPFTGTNAVYQTQTTVDSILIRKLVRYAFFQYYIRPKMIFRQIRNYYIKPLSLLQFFNLIIVTMKTISHLLRF
ncbi:MAG: B12-binding domain-containing radical SAM protein [Candidatus Helarchaeota archaeon]